MQMKIEQLDAGLASRVSDAWWHETLRLFAAQTDASSVISLCMEESSRSPRALLLAAECDAEAFEIRSDVRNQLWMLTEEAIESKDIERQSVGAELLLAARLREISGLRGERHVTATPVTNSEYHLFVHEMHSHKEFLWPYNWNNGAYPVGSG
jgi:hypothetical protein